MSDIVTIAHTLAQTLEKLGVVYWIGGSMASAIHGVPRSTQDVDFVAELKEEQVDDLVAALESEFYIDREVVRHAVRSRRSFNVIHLDTMYKADVFVMSADGHAQAEMQRRRIEPLGPEPNSPTAYFCSAEDIVLQKLRWFRRGGGISDKQWNDLLSVLKVQANALDYDYLRHWAAELGVDDLLIRAFDDAGVPPTSAK